MINIPLIKHAPMTAFPQITSSCVIVRNTLNLTKNINLFHFVESLEQRIRFWSHANYIMVYLCFFPHNVTRKTNDLLVDPVLVELEII